MRQKNIIFVEIKNPYRYSTSSPLVYYFNIRVEEGVLSGSYNLADGVITSLEILTLSKDFRNSYFYKFSSAMEISKLFAFWLWPRKAMNDF